MRATCVSFGFLFSASIPCSLSEWDPALRVERKWRSTVDAGACERANACVRACVCVLCALIFPRCTGERENKDRLQAGCEHARIRAQLITTNHIRKGGYSSPCLNRFKCIDSRGKGRASFSSKHSTPKRRRRPDLGGRCTSRGAESLAGPLAGTHAHTLKSQPTQPSDWAATGKSPHCARPSPATTAGKWFCLSAAPGPSPPRWRAGTLQYSRTRARQGGSGAGVGKRARAGRTNERASLTRSRRLNCQQQQAAWPTETHRRPLLLLLRRRRLHTHRTYRHTSTLFLLRSDPRRWHFDADIHSKTTRRTQPRIAPHCHKHLPSHPALTVRSSNAMSLQASSSSATATGSAASAPSQWSTAAGKPQLSYADRLRMAKEAKKSGSGSVSVSGNGIISANGSSGSASADNSTPSADGASSQQQQPTAEPVSKHNEPKTVPTLSQLPAKPPQAEESMPPKVQATQAESSTPTSSTSAANTTDTAKASTTPSASASAAATALPAMTASPASAPSQAVKSAPATQSPVNIWELRKKQMAEAAAAKEKEREREQQQQRLAAAADPPSSTPLSGPSTTASQAPSTSTSLDSSAQPLSKSKKKQRANAAKAAAAAAAAAASETQQQQPQPQPQPQQLRPASGANRQDNNSTPIVPAVDSKTMVAAKNQQKSNASSVDSRTEALRTNESRQQIAKKDTNSSSSSSNPVPQRMASHNNASSSSSKVASQGPSAEGSPRQQHPPRQRHQLPPNPSRTGSPMKRPPSSSIVRHTPVPSADHDHAWLQKIHLLNDGQNIPARADTAQADVGIGAAIRQVDDEERGGADGDGDDRQDVANWDDEPSVSASSQTRGPHKREQWTTVDGNAGGQSSMSPDSSDEYSRNSYHSSNKGHYDTQRSSPSGSRPRRGNFYSAPSPVVDGGPNAQMANLYLGSPASRTGALDGDEGPTFYHHQHQHYDSPGGSSTRGGSKSRNLSPAHSSKYSNNDRNQARRTQGNRNGGDDQSPGRDDAGRSGQRQPQQQHYQHQQHPQQSQLMMMGLGPMHAYGMATIPPTAGYILPVEGVYSPEGTVVSAHPATPAAAAASAAATSDGSFAPVRIIESHSYGSNTDAYSPGAQVMGLPLVTPYPPWQSGHHSHSHEHGRRPPRTPVRKRGAGAGGSGRGRGQGNHYSHYNRRYEFNKYGSGGFSRHEGAGIGENGSHHGQYDASLSPPAVPSRTMSPNHASEPAGAMAMSSSNNGEASASSSAAGVPGAQIWPYATAVPLVTDGYHWYPVEPAFVHHLPAGQQVFDSSHQQSQPQQHTQYQTYAAFAPTSVDVGGNPAPLRYAPLVPMPTMVPMNGGGYPVDPLARSTNAPESPISRLIGQIEFYFSDENLTNDLFLRQQMDGFSGWVPLSLIASFKRLAKLCTELQIDFDTPGVKERLRVHPDVEMDMEGKRIRKRFKWEQWIMVDADARGSNRPVMDELPSFTFNVGSPEVMATTPTTSPPSHLHCGPGSYGTQQSPYTPPQHGISDQLHSSPGLQDSSPSHHQQQRRLSRGVASGASPSQLAVHGNAPMVPVTSYHPQFTQPHTQHQLPHQPAHPYHLQLYPSNVSHQPLMVTHETNMPGEHHVGRDFSSTPSTAQDSSNEQREWRQQQQHHSHHQQSLRMSASPASAPHPGQSMEHHHSDGGPAGEMPHMVAISGPPYQPAFYAAPQVTSTSPQGAYHIPHYGPIASVPYYPQGGILSHHVHRASHGSSAEAVQESPDTTLIHHHHHHHPQGDAAMSGSSGDGLLVFDSSSVHNQETRQHEEGAGPAASRVGAADIDPQNFDRQYGTDGDPCSSSMLPSPSKVSVHNSGPNSTGKSYGYGHQVSSSSAGVNPSDTLPTPPGSSSASAAHSRQSTTSSAQDGCAGKTGRGAALENVAAHDAAEDDQEDDEDDAGLGIVAAEGLGLGGLIGSDPASRG